jgi:hypothetical protein
MSKYIFIKVAYLEKVTNVIMISAKCALSKSLSKLLLIDMSSILYSLELQLIAFNVKSRQQLAYKKHDSLLLPSKGSFASSSLAVLFMISRTS